MHPVFNVQNIFKNVTCFGKIVVSVHVCLHLVKEESEKAGLKLNIQKTKILASGPIISWKIDGETMKTVLFFGRGEPQNLAITADGD